MKLSETWFIYFDISNHFYTIHVCCNEIQMLKQFRYWARIARCSHSLQLDGPGIESQWGRDLPHPSRPALGPTQPPIQWVPGLFPGVKCSGCSVNHSPPSSAEVKERVELYLFTPLWPSWPVHLYFYLYLKKNTDLTLHVVSCKRRHVFRSWWCSGLFEK
jgi:hypothetical protein